MFWKFYRLWFKPRPSTLQVLYHRRHGQACLGPPSTQERLFGKITRKRKMFWISTWQVLAASGRYWNGAVENWKHGRQAGPVLATLFISGFRQQDGESGWDGHFESTDVKRFSIVSILILELLASTKTIAIGWRCHFSKGSFSSRFIEVAFLNAFREKDGFTPHERRELDPWFQHISPKDHIFLFGCTQDISQNIFQL